MTPSLPALAHRHILTPLCLHLTPAEITIFSGHSHRTHLATIPPRNLLPWLYHNNGVVDHAISRAAEAAKRDSTVTLLESLNLI